MKKLLALGLLLCGCDNVAYIELTPGQVVFKQPNNQVWLQAKCMSRQGVYQPKARVSWAVRDPEIAKISEKGELSPLKSGQTEAIAKYQDVESRVPVSVLFVERVEVEPKSLTLKEGDAAVRLSIKAFGANGVPITDRTAVLNSRDKQVAQIVGGGAEILPLDSGSTTIDVSVDGVKTSVTLVVESGSSKKK